MIKSITEQCLALTFTILAGHLALVNRDIGSQEVLHEDLEALLLLGAELLENGARLGARLEVPLMSCQLDPWIPLFLVRLEEGCPLYNIPDLAPAGALKGSRLNKNIIY